MRLGRYVFHAIIVALMLPQMVLADDAAEPGTGSCATVVLVEDTSLRKLSPSEIEYGADRIHLKKEYIDFVGDARLRDQFRTLRSDRMFYVRASKTLDATGNVTISEPDSRYSGEAFHLDLNRNTVSGEDVKFMLLSDETLAKNEKTIVIRGNAGELMTEDGVWTLDDTLVTHCPETVEDVAIVASQVELDTNSQQGIARNAILKVKNIPILYSPAILFTLSEQRTSGFLFPTLGYRSRYGMVIEIPYYFNLAPNYDATLSTNILTKRGLQLRGEFRHLGVHSDTEINAEILPDDRRHANRADRYAAKIESNWSNGSTLFASLNSSWISDRNYNDDLSGLFDDSDDKYVTQNVEAGFVGNRYKASIGMNRYVIADKSVQDSERTHDRIPWAAYQHIVDLGNRLILNANLRVDRFRHATKLSATRYRTDTAFESEHRRKFGELTLRAGGETIDYRRMANVAASAPDRFSSSTTYVDLDARAFFDRFTTVGDKARTWTLEPRIKLLTAQKKRQDAFPVFDTTIRSIDEYEDLFHSHPYAGGDRMRDVEQISLGVSLGLDSSSGYSGIRHFGIGRVFYTDNRSPTLDTASQDASSNKDKSDLFVGAQIRQSNWQLKSGLLYDDSRKQINQSTIKASYKYHNDAEVSSVYRYRRGDDKQIGALFDVPLKSGWAMKFALIESLERNSMIDSQLQLDYQSCCLNVGLRVKRERDDSNRLENSFKLFISIEGFGIN